MNAEKREIRQVTQQRRGGLSPADVVSASAAVCARLQTFPPYQAALSVLAYVAADNEISLAALIDAAIGSGRTVYLPQLGDRPAWVRWRPGEPLVPAYGRVLQPCGTPQRPAIPAVALVPVVAWDEEGTRLGRGGGFYDRIFADFGQGIVRVGVGYECQRYPHLPSDSWDMPLHFVITEQRIVRCAGGERVHPALLQKGGLQP
jgi:5-formyltetrahydrofolate cyclo-ligase